MNIKSTLSALCLCLMASAANAEIVNYTSYYEQWVFAGGDGATGNFINNSHREELADVTSYSNTLYASATDSITLDPLGNPVTYSTSANASSTLTMNADIGTGVFSASGSYGVGSPGWLTAGSDSDANFSFDLTSAYAYTLDMTVSAGSTSAAYFFSSAGFSEGFNSCISCLSNAAFSVHQSGILGVGSFYIGAFISGRDSGGYLQQAGVPEEPVGSFQYTLTLTPTAVPVPAAVWLFGSGLLGLIGVARRKAA